MKNGEVDQNLTIFLCKKNVTSGSDGDGFSRWNPTITILPPGTEYIGPKSS
jgi:hypothetical protein